MKLSVHKDIFFLYQRKGTTLMAVPFDEMRPGGGKRLHKSGLCFAAPHGSYLGMA